MARITRTHPPNPAPKPSRRERRTVFPPAPAGYPAPTLTTIAPAVVGVADAVPDTFTFTGTNFVPESVVVDAGIPLATPVTYLSATQLQITYLFNNTPQTKPLAVRQPDGQTSNVVTVDIMWYLEDEDAP